MKLARTLALCTVLLTTTASTLSAQSQPDGKSCPRPSDDPAFAIAGFNEAKVVGSGVRRELIGNSFLIYARPGTVVPNSSPVQRRWHTVVVTARHVIRQACKDAQPDVRLTLLPPDDSISRQRPPIEVEIDAAWCDLRRDALGPEGPDIFAFEQTFDLPLRALITPYAIGDTPLKGSELAVAGFVPTNVFARADRAQPSSTYGPQYPGLHDERTRSALVNLPDAANGQRTEIRGEPIAPGQSGSPVIHKDTNTVVGVLVNNDPLTDCASALASARNRLGVRTPQSTGEGANLEQCDRTQGLQQQQNRELRTGYMLPVMNFAWLYTDMRLYTSDQRQALSERIDAAFYLYTESLAALDRPTSQVPVEEKRALERDFKRALRRLTVIEQIQLWTKVRQSDENRGINRLYSDTCFDVYAVDPSQ